MHLTSKHVIFRRWLAALALIFMAAGIWFGLRWHRERVDCQQREAAFEARIETIQRESKMRLPIGTRSEQIISFLEERGFSAFLNRSRTPNEVVGTAQDVGCPPDLRLRE